MLNQCILVGGVVEINNDEENAIITISIARNYKEPGENEYKNDLLDIELSDNLSATAFEYITENATLGIKARLAQRSITVESTEIKTHAIIAEKLTFINTKKKE